MMNLCLSIIRKREEEDCYEHWRRLVKNFGGTKLLNASVVPDFRWVARPSCPTPKANGYEQEH